MNVADYTDVNGISLSELFAKREVTPKKLTNTYTKAIENVNPKINDVIEAYLDYVEVVNYQ